MHRYNGTGWHIVHSCHLAYFLAICLSLTVHLVADPQPGFVFPRQQWSQLKHFRTAEGDGGTCQKRWRLTDSDLCPCGETQTMSHIIDSCPLTKLDGGLSRFRSAVDYMVQWLANLGRWTRIWKRNKK